MDLSNLNVEDFSARIGDEFRIAVNDGDPVTLVLTAAEVQAAAETTDRTDSAFSVVFRGPLNSPLPQQIFEMEHPEMGTLPLFIVPVQQDEQGIYYEAIFTRLEA